MKTLRKLPDGRWAIARRPFHRRIGLTLLGVAVLLAVVNLTLTSEEEYDPLMWLEVVVVAVVGALQVRAKKAVVVDAEVGSIDLGQGPVRGRDFATVRLDSRIDRRGKRETLLYTVSLTRLQAEPGANGSLETELTRTPNEAEAWKIAELLARAFDLPMLDSSDGRLTQRAPTQLDQPLGERLASAGTLPLDPGDPPSGITLEASGGRLYLAWRAPLAGVLAGLTFLMAMTALALWLALDHHSRLGWSLSALWVGLGIAVVVSERGKGRNVLEISAGVLHHTIHFPYRCVTIVPVRRIEHVRDQLPPSPTVSIVSDDGIVVLHGTPEHCSWIRRKLEHWLATHASGRRVP
jgi:hypothetical protein